MPQSSSNPLPPGPDSLRPGPTGPYLQASRLCRWKTKRGFGVWDTGPPAVPAQAPHGPRPGGPCSVAGRHLGARRGAGTYGGGGQARGSLRRLWARAGRPALGVSAAVEEAAAARFFARSGPRGIYPSLDEPLGPRDTLPTRLSAQYLINRLLSFCLRLMETFRDGNPSVPVTSGPNWVRNDATLGKSRSRYPIASGQSSSVCRADAPSPLLRNEVPWHLRLLIKIEQSDSFLGLPQLFCPLRRQDKLHF